MPQIIPIKDLKNTAEISELCHSVQEPIFITKNGYGDMVLMSMEVFEQHTRTARIYEELEISEQQTRDGKTKDAREHVLSMREKYGL